MPKYEVVVKKEISDVLVVEAESPEVIHEFMEAEKKDKYNAWYFNELDPKISYYVSEIDDKHLTDVQLASDGSVIE